MSTTNAAVLAKPAILEAVRSGDVFVSNFDERQVNNSSYDVRLGQVYYEETEPNPKDPRTYVLDPYDPQSVNDMWGVPVPNMNRKPFYLPPGAFILAHTEEFIGCVDTFTTTMIKARSTTGRSAIQICACAGWGDVGFATRWTLEIKNNSRYHSILLRPGQRIGQIVFLPTTGIAKEDLYHKRGKYQREDIETLKNTSHEELAANWDPRMMLPRAWEDWDAQEVLDGAL